MSAQPSSAVGKQTEDAEQMEEEAIRTPTVREAIPSAILKLGEPRIVEFPAGGVSLAVTAASQKAQEHVLQGMAHLDAGWDFEAARHFAVAMQEDANCLLAHWGMAMALMSPSAELRQTQAAVVTRLLDLAVKPDIGNELERGYAFGLVKYLQDGPGAAANALRAVSRKYPNDMQAGIMEALVSRGGFDDMGEPKEDQVRAEAKVAELCEKHPGNPVPLNVLLTIRAEAGDLTAYLDRARELCILAPEYPPYFHLLGHYEWRCGNHAEAAAAFGRASLLYRRWMQDQKVSVADCPEWVRAEAYRVVAIHRKGDITTAMSAAKALASTKVEEKRALSAGARVLLWEGRTLQARILLGEDQKGSAERIFSVLPTAKEMQALRKTSTIGWWVDGLRIATESKRLVDSGSLDKAAETINALSQHLIMMDESREMAQSVGEYSEWMRANMALRVLEASLRGKLALAGPKAGRGSAFNWFSSAADMQKPATMMLAPVLLAPAASQLGDYQLEYGSPADAAESFRKALRLFPGDVGTIKKLQRACRLAKDAPGEAEASRLLKKFGAK